MLQRQPVSHVMCKVPQGDVAAQALIFPQVPIELHNFVSEIIYIYKTHLNMMPWAKAWALFINAES